MRQARAAATRSSSREAVAQEIGAPVEVRRHPGARRMTLRVSRTRHAVIVTVPSQCNDSDAQGFLESNLDWVKKRLHDLPSPARLKNGGEMPLRGVLHRIVFTGAGTRRGVSTVTRIPAYAGRLPELHVSGALEHAPRRLIDWLFAEARRDLDAAVQVHARRLGLKPKRIAVRDQSSRWGSCSTTRVLSFSWRLVLAPPLVLDYVAAHEVAHLAEMNHGPRFWALVARTMPRLEEAKRWLQAHGIELHRYQEPARRSAETQ